MDQRIGQLRCGGCDSVFNKQSSLSRHEKIHWAALRCGKDGCEKSFSSHKHLYKHLKRHSDTNLIVQIVPFNIRTKFEVKEKLSDVDGSLLVRPVIIKKEEEGDFKVKIEVKDKPTEKCNVQLCKRIKKEENDDDEPWDGDECDCDECRVERMIKLEHDQTGEKEFDQNNGLPVRGCVKIKKEVVEDESRVNIELKRHNKKQRIDNMTEKEDAVPVATPTLLHIVKSSNGTKLENDDRVDKIDVADPENESEQGSGDDDLLTNGQIDDDELDVNNSEDDHDDDTEVNEEYDENYEENEQMNDCEVNDGDVDTEIDEKSEPNEGEQKHSNVISNNRRKNVSNRQLVQLSAKNYVKRIEPDELGNRFECDYEGCGRRWKHKHHLIEHIRRHTGEKPFKCSWNNCCRTFYRKDKLKEHFNTHTGHCLYSCTWPGCSAAFKHSTNLTAHTRIHLNDRRHRCDWPGCVKTFIRSSHLKIHQLRHTGERPHKCDWPGCV